MLRLPAVLRVYWIGLIGLFALAFAASWFFVHVEHRTEFPYANVLLPPVYNRVDFTCFSDRFQHFHELAFFGKGKQVFNYPAPLAVVYEVFYRTFAHPAERFRQVFLVAYLATGFAFAWHLRRRNLPTWVAVSFTATAMVLSYPFLMVFYLENVELAVWVLVALGIWLYTEDHSWASVACFGMAGSMKYFPIIYLGLALARRQYRQVAFGLLVCVLTTLVSLALLGPSLPAAYNGLHAQMPVFTEFYVYNFHPLESGIDHSLFAVVKLIIVKFHHLPWLKVVLWPYLGLAALAGLLAYVLRIRKSPPINQILTLSVASVLLPPISHDYTLIHLYAPWVLITFYAISFPRDKRLWIIFACFLLLFTPQNYLITTVERLGGAFRIGGQIKAVALIVLFVCGLVFSLSEDAPYYDKRLNAV